MVKLVLFISEDGWMMNVKYFCFGIVFKLSSVFFGLLVLVGC